MTWFSYAKSVWRIILVAAPSTTAAWGHSDFPVAKRLPDFDVRCYRSYLISFAESYIGQNIQIGDSHVRFDVYTAHNLTLNINTEPDDKAVRHGWGRSAGDLNIGAGENPANPLFLSWTQDDDFGISYYTYSVKDKGLVVVTMRTKSPLKLKNSTEVLRCVDR